MLHPNWPIYLQILLAIHIAFGGIAFICAPVALATAKGGKTHRLWGKIYFWCMTGVAVTALILSIALPIAFLAMVAVFSFYAAFAGYRILYLKDMFPRNGSEAGHAKPIDWAAAVITIASSAVLFAMGFWKPYLMHVGIIMVAGHPISIVSVVFGLLGIRLGTNSIQGFLKCPKTKMFWWFAHMQGMIASYIAAMTAFSAVNLSHWFGAAWWVWLWPTLIGVPTIALWTRYYEKKFAPKPKPAAA
jgi:uncharacterized membrane protein